jgi:hypothetical protein
MVVPTSAKPAGSQLTEDDCELKGIGSGPSPPTYPRANSFKAIDAFPDVAGAKALADPAMAATVTRNLFMVAGFQGKKWDLSFLFGVIAATTFGRVYINIAYLFVQPRRTPLYNVTNIYIFTT